MRRKRRRIQYYNAEPTKERLRDKPWLPFLLVALAALVIALIVGAILGGIAERTDREGIPYGDLADLGGVDAPDKTYDTLQFAGNYNLRGLSVANLDERF